MATSCGTRTRVSMCQTISRGTGLTAGMAFCTLNYPRFTSMHYNDKNSKALLGGSVFTVLASAIGFFSSLMPQVLKLWNNKQDNTQKLAILDRQIELSKNQSESQFKASQLLADTEEIKSLHVHDASLSGGDFVEGLRASVRPVITYSIFVLVALIVTGAVPPPPTVWGESIQVIFSGVISFWFGSRAVSKI